MPRCRQKLALELFMYWPKITDTLINICVYCNMNLLITTVVLYKYAYVN